MLSLLRRERDLLLAGSSLLQGKTSSLPISDPPWLALAK